VADKDVKKEADAERESHPGTEPFVPDFDTGSRPLPVSGADSPPADVAKEPEAPSSAATATEHAAIEPAVTPVTVPGRYQYLKWWKLVLVMVGVWIGAAEVGLSLFYWWFHTIDKTGPVFMVLVYVVTCTVAGVLLAMVQGRPLVSALALGVISGPFASVLAAAPLYGYYFCERTGHCLFSVIPY
jgi:hypothetical protein